MQIGQFEEMKLTAFAQWYQYVKRRVQDERVEVMVLMF